MRKRLAALMLALLLLPLLALACGDERVTNVTVYRCCEDDCEAPDPDACDHECPEDDDDEDDDGDD